MHVYLRVKLPWLVHSAIAGGVSIVAAAVRNPEASSAVKPGGFQPVSVAMDTATLQLTGMKTKYSITSKTDLQFMWVSVIAQFLRG